MYDFKYILKKVREYNKLSQKDLADKIPMNQSNYSKIERGTQEPSINQLRKICQVLNLDANFLLGVDEDNRELISKKDITAEEEKISTKDIKLLTDIKKLISKYSDKDNK